MKENTKLFKFNRVDELFKNITIDEFVQLKNKIKEIENKYPEIFNSDYVQEDYVEDEIEVNKNPWEPLGTITCKDFNIDGIINTTIDLNTIFLEDQVKK